MKKRILLLGYLLTALSFCPSEAAETISAPDLVVDGSVPLQYDSNAARTRQKQSDYVFSPFFRLSASGQLLDDFSYSVYASTGFDDYFKLKDDNVSQSATGVQASRAWSALRLGASYERIYYYDRLYGSQIRTANDIQFFARYNYVNSAGDLKIRPSMSITTRADDQFSVERTLFRFKVDLERKVADRWWIFATPSLRVYDYVSGRLDDIYSITTGLRYDITRDVSLTSSVGYESRNSSSSSRNFNNMVVGLSLDFSYTLFSAGKDDKLWKTLERPSCEDQSQLSC